MTTTNDNKPPEKQEFDCVEPGCDQKVIYVPDEIPGELLARSLAEENRPYTFTAYLTCPRQHTHPYQVTVN